MTCDNRITGLYAWLDGELGPAEAAEFQKHLQTCPSCREEYALWEEVRHALRGETAGITAPAGLVAGVMEQINRAEKPRVLFFPLAWKRAIAAVAASLLIACGSYGIALNSGFLNGARLASNDPGHTITDPAETGNTTLPANNAQTPGTANPNPGEQDIVTRSEPGDERVPAGTGNNGEDSEAVTVQGTQNTDSSEASQTTEMVALLNTDKQRVIYSTLIKISVEEPGEAEAMLAGLAAKYSAVQDKKESIQTINGSSEVYELIAPEDKIGPLLSELNGIGVVTARDGSAKDITGEYNRQVERYQSLQAQLISTGDAVEKQSIEAEMDAVAKQLKEWEKATGVHRVVVWLEN